MRAVVFDRVGEPNQVLQLREVDTPTPRWGEVLVRMIASPVNPSDLMYIRGIYGIRPTLPATPGFEGVGIVEATGGGVLGWLRKGKRVAVLNDRWGNWSEYTVTSARQVIPIPHELTDTQAASFFVNPATAVVVLTDVFQVQRGDWVLQTAANGALGRMIVRLAHRLGARTINIVRQRSQMDELKAIGATEVLTVDEFTPERIRELTGDGVRFALDPVGGALGTRACECLAPRGRLVLYGSLSGEPVAVDPRWLLTGSKSVEGFWLADWVKRQRIARMLRLIRQVREWVRAGVLQTDSVETFPLERIRDAVNWAETPNTAAKAILLCSDPYSIQ